MEENRSIKVLIVEDQPDVQESIRISVRTINDFYVEFKEASNGEKALKILQGGYLPDVIISDIMMPVMDGFEFCKRVKESHLWCCIPFIFLTAKVEALSHESGLKIGAVAYIEKPFDPRVLGASVRTQVINYWQVRDRLSHSVNTLLSVFSHEAGTSLNNIMGFTDLLLESREISLEHQSWLKNIFSSAERLEKLRRKSALLIEIQHIDSLSVEWHNVLLLMENALRLCKAAAKKNRVVVTTDFKGTPNMALHRSFMIDALTAVVENAIQFSPIGGRVEVSVENKDKEITIVVKDEGPGISKDRTLEIFEPFVTVSNVLNHQKGTGLSLAIAKRITELHYGTLTVLPGTEDFPGAQFRFHFPNTFY